METVRPSSLPSTALLSRYAREGAYTDCFTVAIDGPVTHARFVEVFYTGALFRLERLVLRLALGRPSTDVQVRELAAGTIDHFAAWRVEARAPDQLLLCDIAGRTRSWLMVAPAGSGAGAGTRLYFGSAVVPRGRTADGAPRMGTVFRALLGFHALYSRLLLASARARLVRGKA